MEVIYAIMRGRVPCSAQANRGRHRKKQAPVRSSRQHCHYCRGKLESGVDETIGAPPEIGEQAILCEDAPLGNPLSPRFVKSRNWQIREEDKPASSRILSCWEISSIS